MKIFNPPTITVDSAGRLKAIPDAILCRMMEHFCLENPKYTQAAKYGRKYGLQGLEKTLKYYRLEKDEFVFPRGATRVVVDYLQRCGLTPIVKDNRTCLPQIKGLKFVGKLRQYQADALKDILNNDFGLVEAGTGAGKTVIACAAIAKRSVPTLVIVPTKDLLYQWAERLKQFTTATDELIGFIGDDHFDIKPITIGIINTVAGKVDQLEDCFDYVVVDEAHRSAAAMYIEGPLMKLRSRMMSGLSATFMRSDDLTLPLYWFLGGLVHSVDPEMLRRIGAILTPKIYQQQTNFVYHNPSNYQKMIAAMIADVDRNNLIAQNVVNDVMFQKGRGVVLVVSDRTDHLKTLNSLICREIPSHKVGLLTGQAKKEERLEMTERLKNGDICVLVATLQLIAEGYDCPGLSSTHFATPIAWKGRIIQTIGRILRPMEGKDPLIVDYADTRINTMRKKAADRLEIFIRDTYAIRIDKLPWNKSVIHGNFVPPVNYETAYPAQAYA